MSTSTLSPWLSACACGEVYTIPVSHGEGRFVASPEVLAAMLRGGQIATQYFERFYDREWGDVTPQKYFIFYMRAMLPLIIVYAGFVVFSFYPQMDMLESFRYPVYVVGGMFVAAAMGYRS